MKLLSCSLILVSLAAAAHADAPRPRAGGDTGIVAETLCPFPGTPPPPCRHPAGCPPDDDRPVRAQVLQRCVLFGVVAATVTPAG